jgi:hypothetical protein
VEEYDTTTVVRPGWTVRLDEGNNMILDRIGSAAASAGASLVGPRAVDPVRRELFRNALTTVADTMIVTVVRTSRSEVVKSSLDFSSAICDGRGRMIAQGLALPAHLGSMMPALQGCLDRLGGDLRPGDVLASNDPYSGASHLNDIYMFKPVFAEGRPAAFSASSSTTRTWAGGCREGTPPTRPRSSRKGCASRPPRSCRKASRTPRS